MEEAEVWRTSPLSSLRKKKRRAGPAAAADGGPLWLVWEDEGGVPLSSLLARRDWPACAEPLLFGRPLAGIPPGPRRRRGHIAPRPEAPRETQRARVHSIQTQTRPRVSALLHMRRRLQRAVPVPREDRR